MAQTVDDAKRSKLVALHPTLDKAPIDDLWQAELLAQTGGGPENGLALLEKVYWMGKLAGAGGPAFAVTETWPVGDIKFAALKALIVLPAGATVDDYSYKYWTT